MALLCAALALSALAHADEAVWRNFMAAATEAAKRSEHALAAASYENAVKAAEDFGSNDTRMAAALYGLGRAKRALHEYPAAGRSLLRALAILEAAPGPPQADHADVLNALGDLKRVEGSYTEAEVYYRRELALLEKLYGAVHPAVARALANNLASLYRAQGRNADAEAAYRRALAILEKSVPAGDERLGACLD